MHKLIVSRSVGEDTGRVSLDLLLEPYGEWSHVHNDVWLLTTDQSAEQVRNQLQTLVDPSDQLFISELKQDVD